MIWLARLRRWWNGPPPRPLGPEPVTQEELLDMLLAGKSIEEALDETRRRLDGDGTNPHAPA